MPAKTAILLSTAATILTAAAQPEIPGYDFTKAAFVYSGGMDLDETDGDMEIYSFEARTALSRPISPTNAFTILPVIQYKGTRVNFRDTPAGFPIEDEDVHSISLSSFFLYSVTGSPWLFGAWARAELATDFQHINDDDITFDVVAGAGYKFSENLTVGLGVAAINLNNDEDLYVGPAFDWKINDCWRVGLLGPNAVATYSPDENWEFSLRGDASGDEWNIRDAAGNSTTLDLDMYRVGLYADRRLTGDLWLRVGAGITVANEIEIKSPGGDRYYEDELDEGWFGEIALRLKVW